MTNPATPKETTGVIYISTGKKHIEMAIRSAISVRKHSPKINIHLFADWQEQGFDFTHSCAPFSTVENIHDVKYHSKVYYMHKTPYERTLYLDADTKVVTDVELMFTLLDRFDMALAHAPERVNRLHNWKVEIPDSFPQFNSGVIVYKKSKDVEKVWQEWEEAFTESRSRDDQLTFREVLWLSNLRIATLAPEYNLRFVKYIFVWSRREAKPKILHLHMYRRGLLWLISPWIVTLKIKYKKLTGKPDNFH